MAEVKRAAPELSNLATLKKVASTDTLVKEVSQKLDAFINGEVPAKGQVGSDNNINLALASTVGEAMTKVINTMETCLEGHDGDKPAKRWLASVKSIVESLTCQNGCVNLCPPHAKDLEVNTECKELGGQSRTPQPCITPAVIAVSEVLVDKMKSCHSAPSSTGCAEETVKNDHISRFFLQPIEETAAGVIETFVKEMKTVVQSLAERTCTVDNGDLVQTDASLAKKNQVQIEAKKIYYKIMMKLKVFFGQLPFQQGQTIASDLLNVDDTAESPGLERQTQSEQVLVVTRPLGSGALSKVHSDHGGPFSPILLNTCTKDVLKAVISSYLEPLKQGQKSIVQGTSVPVPSANSSDEDSLLFYLNDLTSSSFSISEDSFSTFQSDLTGDSTSEKFKDVSIPFMKKLSRVEFQLNAFEEVTNVLATFLRSHTSLQSRVSNNSCEKDNLTSMPWLDYFSKNLDSVAMDVIDQIVYESLLVDGSCSTISDGQTSIKGSDEVVAPLTDAIHKLCHDDLHTQVAKDVGQVLLQSAESFTGSASHLSVQTTASDVVETVVGGIQAILHSTSGKTSASSDVKGASERSLPNFGLKNIKHFNSTMLSVTCEMFRGLQEKVKNFLTKNLQQTKDCTESNAKQTISNALVCIKDLRISRDSQRSEDLKMVHDILNLMLNNITEVVGETGQDITETSSEETESRMSLSTWSKSTEGSSTEDSLPRTMTISEVDGRGNIIRQKHFRVRNSMENGSHGGISLDTIVSVVKTVSERHGLEDEACSSSQHGDLNLVTEKIQESLSNLTASPQDLVGKIYDLFREDSSSGPHKCVSDTVLLKFRDDEHLKKQIASQLVHSYAEETAKHFLLPCFKLPASGTMEQSGSLAPASASASCPGFISGEVLDGQDTHTSKSPSELLTGILKVLTDAMVRDVMYSFSSLASKVDTVCENQTKNSSNASQKKKSKTIKMGILQFLQKIPKVKIFHKKCKTGLIKKELAPDSRFHADIVAESTGAVVQPCEDATHPEQATKEQKPQKSSCFSRLIAAVMRKKSRVSPV
ncbi:uncharacterized protein LOC134098012 [Sardina pilchardus]|uniref:uncharacterized protein LOC134098012 n=1 Tax=Sardina pilchardus TaxID=27697 RepID=UPI002E109252